METPHEVRDEQARLWNGPSGRAWVENQELLDRMYKPFEDLLVRAAAAKPRRAVLDVGCGPGRLAIPLARKVGPQCEVVAMDMQGRMLQRAQHKARAANLTNIQFLQAGAGEGKLGRDRFDRALLVTVLGEIPNRQTALREIFDALKPGGILSVTEVIFDPHFQSRQTVARLACSVGFRENACHGSRIAFTFNFEKTAS